MSHNDSHNTNTYMCTIQHTQTDRHKHTDTDTHRHRHTHTDTDTQTQTQTHNYCTYQYPLESVADKLMC